MNECILRLCREGKGHRAVFLVKRWQDVSVGTRLQSGPTRMLSPGPAVALDGPDCSPFSDIIWWNGSPLQFPLNYTTVSLNC